MACMEEARWCWADVSMIVMRFWVLVISSCTARISLRFAFASSRAFFFDRSSARVRSSSSASAAFFLYCVSFLRSSSLVATESSAPARSSRSVYSRVSRSWFGELSLGVIFLTVPSEYVIWITLPSSSNLYPFAFFFLRS